MTKVNAYEKILKVAEGLIQTQGYNAFSYRDIATQIGIKTSSIHYHFPTKADLAKAVVKNHISSLSINLEDLINDKTKTCCQKLTAFFDAIFAATYAYDSRMCLGGMLASDVLTLPESIQHEVREFFRRIEDWLRRLLNQGVESKEYHLNIDVTLEITMILSSLEGALLLARLYQDDLRLAQVKEAIIARLSRA
ncbi:MAG: TetR family transcriptional regulator [Coxiella sp. (in: Bacteria)]|nr:MAG: TetR family transcriptional regulator [Coxiella sp. (in: g-proteobacteria)]